MAQSSSSLLSPFFSEPKRRPTRCPDAMAWRGSGFVLGFGFGFGFGFGLGLGLGLGLDAALGHGAAYRAEDVAGAWSGPGSGFELGSG